MTDIGTRAGNEFHDQSFTGTVDVDGHHYINCTFADAQLRYGGGPLPRFETCAFATVSWYFHDAALRTIQLLQAQNREGDAKAMLDDLFRPGNFISI